MSFSDPHAVARYADGPLRQVPGFLGLQQMTHLLLAEHVPDRVRRRRIARRLLL